MDARQEPPLAPLDLLGRDGRGREAPAEHAALGLHRGQRRVHLAGREGERRRRAPPRWSGRPAPSRARTISTSAPSRSDHAAARRAGGSTRSGSKRRRGHTVAASERRSAGTQKTWSGARGAGPRARPRSARRDSRSRPSPSRSGSAPRSSSRSCSSSASRRSGQASSTTAAIAAASSAPTSSATDGGQPAAERDRARAALLERGVVEEGVRVGVQDLVRRRRDGSRRLAGHAPDLARVQRREHGAQAVDVHRLGEAVARASRRTSG